MSSALRGFKSVLFPLILKMLLGHTGLVLLEAAILKTATSVSYSETGHAQSRATASISDESGISELEWGEEVRKLAFFPGWEIPKSHVVYTSLEFPYNGSLLMAKDWFLFSSQYTTGSVPSLPAPSFFTEAQCS